MAKKALGRADCDKDFGIICLCAMRYALGRQTYMPSLVQDFIRGHIGEIDSGTIEIMIRDINKADRITEHKLSDGHMMMLDGLGDTKIDRPGWERFRAFLREKLKEKLELLKEQQGVPYVFNVDGETACGSCGCYFDKAYSNCPKCGKKVDWNG